MSWQHELLLAEVALSFVVLLGIIWAGGRADYGGTWGAVSIVWNAASLALLVTGADRQAWQYWVLGAMFTLALAIAVSRTAAGHVEDVLKSGAGPILGSAVLVSAAQVALLVSAV